MRCSLEETPNSVGSGRWGVGSVTPHAATRTARMAVAKTPVAERLLERAAPSAIDAVGLARRAWLALLARPVREDRGEGREGRVTRASPDHDDGNGSISE